MTQLTSLPYYYYYRCVPAQPSVRTAWLMLRPRTTVGAYRLTYVDALRTTNKAYAQLMLLSDRCTKYSILTGIIIDVRYAPRNWCITHSLCRGLFYYVHVITHLMLLPYNLCRTVTQLMLLGHDCTTCVIHSVTYDVMLLTATYVRYLCCSTT
jgi:hypothetical protein